MSACMTMRSLVVGIAIGGLLYAPARADSEQMARIGVLTTRGIPALEEGLRGSLQELGYVEGRNIVIEWRRSTGSDEDLRSMAPGFARSRTDVVVTLGSPATRAVLQATSLPVVFAMVGDPVGTGFAASLARPGGRATGVSTITVDLMSKRLELLHEIAPQARRILFLTNSSNPVAARQLEEVRKAAGKVSVELVKLDARNDAEIAAAVRVIRHSSADAVLVSGDMLFIANSAKIAGAIEKAKLPAMVPNKEYQGNGVLMSYGASLGEAARMAAGYVDKILKGAKPGDLPIEQPTKFELVVNLKAAKALGLIIPESILLRADEVIR